MLRAAMGKDSGIPRTSYLKMWARDRDWVLDDCQGKAANLRLALGRPGIGGAPEHPPEIWVQAIVFHSQSGLVSHGILRGQTGVVGGSTAIVWV